jgi:hypothetical protein
LQGSFFFLKTVLFLHQQIKKYTMSKLQNFYQEEISNGDIHNDLIDDEFMVKQFEEDASIEAQAEEADFFRIFQLTNTYPI